MATSNMKCTDRPRTHSTALGDEGITDRLNDVRTIWEGHRRKPPGGEGENGNPSWKDTSNYRPIKRRGKQHAGGRPSTHQPGKRVELPWGEEEAPFVLRISGRPIWSLLDRVSKNVVLKINPGSV